MARLQLGLRALEQYLDRRARSLFGLLMVCLTVWSWCASQPKPLWFDEQLGLAAARVPHWSDVSAALALPVDINPPLYAFLARGSMELFGDSATAARLPSFLGMVGFLCCLAVFVGRRLRPLYGVLAASLVLCTPIVEYAWEARPYAVLLCLTGIAAVAYQARLGGSRLALPVFWLSCAGLPLTHYYGLLILGAFGVAEAVRTIERRKVDWALASGMVTAPCATMLLLRGLILAQWHALGQFSAHGQVGSWTQAYRWYTPLPWILYLSLAAVGLACLLRTLARNPPREENRTGFSLPELALAVSLMVLPMLGAVAARYTHAYVPRYFLEAGAGVAVVTCVLASKLQRHCAGVALALLLSTAAGVGQGLTAAISRMDQPSPIQALVDDLDRGKVPVVFEDAKVYLMAREADPVFEARFGFAADPERALRLTGGGADDRFMLNLAKLQPVQVWRLDDMARKSSEWLLVPYQYGWLRRCLGRMGDQVKADRPEGFSDAGGGEPFLIHLPPGAMKTAWCEAPAASPIP